MEDGTRTIIFLGAPRAKDIVKTWKAPDGPEISLSKTADVASLPPFEIDPTHASRNVAWRRLPDPLHSLSQEFSETNFGPPTVEPSFIDRSLQGYYNNDDDEMDLHDLPSSVNDGRDTSQIPSPFLAGYDFDINEITELEDLPSARTISGDSSRRFSLVVAVMETQGCELVATKFGTSINLTKLIVGDLTRQQFEIACWDDMATVAQKIHVHDIVYFRGMLLFTRNRLFRLGSAGIQRSRVCGDTST